MESHLTEAQLEHLLNIVFPITKDWFHNKPVLGKFKPDYCSHSLKLVIEFDGYSHYTDVNSILRDERKDILFTQNGYKVVRIPYFVQLTGEVARHLFNIDVSINSNYPHGFISDKSTCKLPANFCELGIERFKHDLQRFDFIRGLIIDSLVQKIDKLKDKRLVLPPSLEYLITD